MAAHVHQSGLDRGQRRVPLGRVVAPGLPRVDQHRFAGSSGIAPLEQEAVPAMERVEQRPGLALIRGP
jgi:hypothetical protein